MGRCCLSSTPACSLDHGRKDRYKAVEGHTESREIHKEQDRCVEPSVEEWDLLSGSQVLDPLPAVFPNLTASSTTLPGQFQGGWPLTAFRHHTYEFFACLSITNRMCLGAGEREGVRQPKRSGESAGDSQREDVGGFRMVSACLALQKTSWI